MDLLALARNLAVAGLVGLAVGIEREWSGHATGPDARFAGIRTFLLLGLTGGVAGLLAGTEGRALAVVLLAIAGALVVAAYVLAARRAPEAIDGTTEAAAVLVLGIGLLAGLGSIRIASGVAAVMVLALSEKDALRRFIGRIDAVELRGAFQFAVLALVVLPLLPEGPYGPAGAIRPRMLWVVVLLISGVNYLGYLARRVVGEARGYVIAGGLGGMISSTAVTLAFARASRREPEQAGALGQGTIAASIVLVPRVLAVILALNPEFVPRAALALLPILAVGVAWLAVGPRSTSGPSASAPASRNPLELGQAIRMAILFQLVLSGIELARVQFGDPGVLAGAAVAGLTDVDALTLTMSRLAERLDLVTLAAQALVVGVVANSVLKSVVAIALGHPDFRRRAVPGLLAMAAVGAATVVWLGMKG
jgi:uncharacterized membrane protein (DUF4010 family)